MTKQIIIAGLLGAVVLIIWTFLINGIFRFKVSMDMKSIPNEREVYEVLKENVIEPGRYACNPQLTPYKRFPEEEPVFSVLYGGVGGLTNSGNQIWSQDSAGIAGAPEAFDYFGFSVAVLPSANFTIYLPVILRP